MSANKENKFPEEQDLSFKSTHPMYMPEHFIGEDVKDWFKRCMADHPKLPKGHLFSERFMYHGVDMYRWYEKWFSQFKKL